MDHQDDPNMPTPPASDDAADAIGPANEPYSADADMAPTYDAASFDPTPPTASAASDAAASGAPDGNASVDASAPRDMYAPEPVTTAPAATVDAPALDIPPAWSMDSGAAQSGAGASVAPDPVEEAVSPVVADAGDDQSATAGAGMSDAGAYAASLPPMAPPLPPMEPPVDMTSSMDATPLPSYAPPPLERTETMAPIAPVASEPQPTYAPPPPEPAYPPPPAYAPPPPASYEPPPASYAPPVAPPTPQFQGYAPVGPMAAPMVPVVPMMGQRRDKTLPIVLEIIPGLFGLFGIGWLVGGYTSTGLAFLIGGLVFDVVMGIGTVITLGLGAFCWIPLTLIVMIISTVMLNGRLDRGM